MSLEFDDRGNLLSPAQSLVEIPLPIIFDLLPWSPPRDRINHTLLRGARGIGSFAVISQQEWEPSLKQYLDHVLLYINQGVETVDPELIRKLRLVEIPDGPRVLERLPETEGHQRPRRSSRYDCPCRPVPANGRWN